MTIRRHSQRVTEREIAALADGSLPAARSQRVERKVAESSDLQAQLRDQRDALDAIRMASDARAPAGLRARVLLANPAPRDRVRLAPRLAAGAAASAAVAATVLLLGASGGGPIVADASALGARPATDTVSGQRHGSAALEGPVASGLRFPYWGDHFGWRATGTREDTLGGRPATTVFYRRGTAVVSYTIVGGGALPTERGTTFRGRTTVTWLRHGHSCVLSSTRASRATLLRLAAWRGAN